MGYKNIATEILEINELWEKTDKITIADNVEEFLFMKHPECAEKWNTKIYVLSEITGAKTDTVYAWLNHSRERVKVPFLKLCQIASVLDVDIKQMFVKMEDKLNNIIISDLTKGITGMYLVDDTPRGKIRKQIIESSTDEQVTMIPAVNFGDIYIIGEQHKEAAEYFNQKIAECKTKGAEIKLHFEIEEKFNVALCNKQ